MKKKNLGHIKIIETPTYISKRNKYLVEVRSYLSIETLEYDSFEINSNTFDILEKKSLKRGGGRVGKIVEKFDKEEGKVFHHYLFYISSDKKYDPEDVAHGLQKHLEINEKGKIQSTFGEKIRLFPWEKSKTISKIPITQKMIDTVVKKKKDELSKSDH